MILVDNRTGSVELAPLLHTPTSIGRLEFGDFCFIGHGPHGPAIVGVERKTTMDLVSSILSGRLSGHQMVGLTREYDWVYLVVEGQWRADHSTGVLYRQNRANRWVEVRIGRRKFKAADVHNFLNTLHVMCGVGIVKTGGMLETALWLDGTCRWWGKEWEVHRSHAQFRKPEKYASLKPPSLVVRVAKEFAGVGWDKARALGKVYRDVGLLASATQEGLMSVPGIGKVLANSICREVKGDG